MNRKKNNPLIDGVETPTPKAEPDRITIYLPQGVDVCISTKTYLTREEAYSLHGQLFRVLTAIKP